MAYRPSRRAIVFAAIAAAVFGAFILLLPEVARRVAVNRLQTMLTVPVAIEDVDINLFTGDAAVKNLVIGDAPAPIARVPLMTFGFSRGALLTGQIDLQSVVLQNPKLIVVRTDRGAYNITEAVALPERTTGDAADFSVSRMAIHGGEITFIDRTQKPDYEISVTALDIAAGPISTLPESRTEPTRFDAGVRIAGGTIKIAGSSTPLADPLDLKLTAEVNNVELEKFAVYLPYGGRLNLRKSAINGRAHYVLAHSGGAVAQHTLEGSLRAGGIALSTSEGNRQVMRLDSVEANDIRMDFAEHQARIGELSIDNPYLLLTRDSTGFNFQQFLPPGPDAASATRDATREQNSADPMPLPWMIERAETRGGRIEFVDETVTPAVQTALHDVNAVAENMLVWPSVDAERIKAEAQIDQGSVDVSGSIESEPLKGEFSVGGKQLPFTPFRGYLDQLFDNARSQGDFVNGKVELTFAPAASGEIVTSIAGRLEGHQMALQFAENETPFLTTQRLEVGVSTIQLGVDDRVEIDEINLRGAHLDFVRDESGNINLSRLWSNEADPRQESTPAQQEQDASEEMPVVIKAVTVEEGAIEIADRSVSPAYTTKISQVNGKVTKLLPATERANVNVEGVLGEAAIVQLSGWFTLFTEKPYMHLEGTVKSYELPPLNPYATEFVSQRIRQGEITTEVSFTMEGDEMRAQTELVLRHVRLGEKTGDDFVQRIGIPLDLAVALLQDVRGVVRLQFEVTADRGAQFNVRALIWEAVKNALIRAITAPFRLVGKILTLGGRIGSVRIEPVRFEPGTREIQDVKQLVDLAELLKQKPRLELRLTGQVSRDEVEGLKKRMFWQRINATGVANYQQALAAVYQDMTGVALNAPLTPRVEKSLEDFILERIEISDEQLRELARERAAAVEQELTKRGVDGERLQVSAGEIVGDGAPAVEFALVS